MKPASITWRSRPIWCRRPTTAICGPSPKQVEALRARSRRTNQTVAREVARIGDVDHRPDHAFPFDYGDADDTAPARGVWEFKASCFQPKTALPSSAFVEPRDWRLPGPRVEVTPDRTRR